eukprot:5995529-Prymnesium_polylepis.1
MAAEELAQARGDAAMAMDWSGVAASKTQVRREEELQDRESCKVASGLPTCHFGGCLSRLTVQRGVVEVVYCRAL